MPRPWNDWYHITGNTYGTWLHGSNLGFRTRHHREHIDGDYKNPPPPDKYRRKLERSRSLMQREPVRLSPQACQLACDTIFGSLRDDGLDVVIVSVDDHHHHILVRVPDNRPRHWVGRAKGRAARALSKGQLLPPGGAWAKRCSCKPVKDRAHQVEVANYIRKHGRNPSPRLEAVGFPSLPLPMYTPTYSPDAPTPDEIASSTGRLVLEFGTNWCPICSGAQADIRKVLEDLPDLTHIKVEDGPGRKLGRSFRVKLWPTLVFLRDGQEVGRVVRPDNADQVRQALSTLTGGAATAEE